MHKIQMQLYPRVHKTLQWLMYWRILYAYNIYCISINRLKMIQIFKKKTITVEYIFFCKCFMLEVCYYITCNVTIRNENDRISESKYQIFRWKNSMSRPNIAAFFYEENYYYFLHWPFDEKCMWSLFFTNVKICKIN